ncbi:DUF4199 domain-containing protein [Pontibacter sp. 13R65]|uniref:DUF4199 domain-containing protein n=1 Tax=Pontibacter sp. 13R65 TaxID=3127458 RepID=UPI00301D41EB
MFNQAIVRIGVRYGVICGIASFALVLLTYFIGYNPLNESGRLSFFALPVFIFLGMKYYKQFLDTELSFFKGLRVGLAISFYTALVAAMLLFIFLYFFGHELVKEYLAEMQRILEATREESIQLYGQEIYEQSLKELGSMSLSRLASFDFMARLVVGSLISVVAAVFFRK